MAEQSVVTKVEDIIKCALCREVLTDPRTFNCLHSYCSKCIKGLTTTTKDNASGYECPECRRFTAQDGIRVVHLVLQLLDAYHTAKDSGKDRKCQRCKKEVAQWCCRECPGMIALCDACKLLHEEFLKHKLLTFDELKDEGLVLEKTIYCSEHNDNKIEVFCKQCEKTMCVLCKIFKHDGHKAEPIADALQRILPQLVSNKEQIKENIKENTEAVTALQKERQEAIESCDNEQQELNIKLDEDIRMLKEKHKKDSMELQTRKTATIKEFDIKIQDVSDKIKEQKHIVAWVKATVTRTKGTTLLQEIQDGLLEKVKHMASEPGYNGSHTKEHQSSRCWLWSKTNGTLALQQTIQLPNPAGGGHPYTRISIVCGDIWMINHNELQIHKYDYEGIHTGTLQISHSINTPRVAIEIHENEEILVAQSGLYTINQQGQVTGTLQLGDFSDAYFANGMLYALEYKQGKVMRFRKSGTQWKKLDEITLQNYQSENSVSGANYVNTIVATSTRIYIAMLNSHRIKRYDLTGNNVTEIGSYATGLYYPSICGIDKNNTLLIANYGKRRLNWLTDNGTKTTVSAYSTFYPWYAVFQNDVTLWIIDTKSKLYRYSYN